MRSATMVRTTAVVRSRRTHSKRIMCRYHRTCVIRMRHAPECLSHSLDSGDPDTQFTGVQAAMWVMNLEGRTILVTGSTDGVGRHVALELAAAGAKVLIHGRSRERAE